MRLGCLAVPQVVSSWNTQIPSTYILHEVPPGNIKPDVTWLTFLLQGIGTVLNLKVHTVFIKHPRIPSAILAILSLMTFWTRAPRRN